METFAAPGVVAEPSEVELQPLPAPSGDLDQCSDDQLLGMIRSGPLGSAQRTAACEVLVNRYRTLVRSCANRYRRSPEAPEDLMQVGYVGLLKAINNFDPQVGRSLAAYAQPCITGEIKRYFRDKRWQVHVERPLQERLLELREGIRQLTQQFGRLPGDAELASHLGFTEAEVREARGVDLLLQPASLDAPLAGQPETASLADLLGEEDPQMEHTLSMAALAVHWGELPRREQRILLMRFYGDMTQAEIGRSLGISQMHVSRLLAHALSYLRDRMLAEPGAETTGMAA
ncbi:MAG TPA: sigma-70 family RNA polymerase sigma factor [Streptosporangiaceae bacterium]|nr:sigma-70 family RNA polymerase sigma factor [Streptosporangiaceae bacterium]